MRRAARIPILALVLLTVGAVYCQDANDPFSPHSAPMEIIRDKPFVSVMINGRGPFLFMVDTGTSGNAVVTPELVSQLKLPVVGEGMLGDPTGVGDTSAPLRLIDTLTVAGLNFYSIKAVEHSLPEGELTFYGLLGFDLFHDYLLTLDYPGSRLTLNEGNLEADGERSVHSFQMPNGIPIARLAFGDMFVDALMDSGGTGLSLPEQLAGKLSFSSPPSRFGRALSLSTQYEIKAGRLAGDVRLGDITFEQPWVEIHPAFPIANFGAVPMHHFTITFDQENLLVRLEGPSKRLSLEMIPLPLRLENTPPPAKPIESALVPIG